MRTCPECDVEVLTKWNHCSRKCSMLHTHRLRGNTRGSVLPCGNCNQPVKIKGCELSRSKSGKAFCNRSCAVTYNNRHRVSTGNVSKFELYCREKLLQEFPLIDFKFNNRKAIGLELDIYVPDLKLAIEINGPTHYTLMYGQDKLDRTKANDKLKNVYCEELGIKLHTIDVSKLSHNKESVFEQYYLIVREIVLLGLTNVNR